MADRDSGAGRGGFDGPVAAGGGFVAVLAGAALARTVLGAAYGVALGNSSMPAAGAFLSGIATGTLDALSPVSLLAPFLGGYVALRWAASRDRAIRTAAIAGGSSVAVVGLALFVVAALAGPGSGGSPLAWGEEVFGRGVVVTLAVLAGGYATSVLVPVTKEAAPGDRQTPENAGRRSWTGGRAPDPERRGPPDADRERRDPTGGVVRRRLAPVVLGFGVLLLSGVAGGIETLSSLTLSDPSTTTWKESLVEFPPMGVVVDVWVNTGLAWVLPSVLVGAVTGLVRRRREWWKPTAGAGIGVFCLAVLVPEVARIAGVDTTWFVYLRRYGAVDAGSRALQAAVLVAVTAYGFARLREATTGVDPGGDWHRSVDARFERRTTGRMLALSGSAVVLAGLAAVADAFVAFHLRQARTEAGIGLAQATANALASSRFFAVGLAASAGIACALLWRERPRRTGSTAAIGATVGYSLLGGSTLVVDAVLTGGVPDGTHPILWVEPVIAPLLGATVVAGGTAAVASWAIGSGDAAVRETSSDGAGRPPDGDRTAQRE